MESRHLWDALVRLSRNWEKSERHDSEESGIADGSLLPAL